MPPTRALPPPPTHHRALRAQRSRSAARCGRTREFAAPDWALAAAARRRYPCLGRPHGRFSARAQTYSAKIAAENSRSISSCLKRRPCSSMARAASAARDRSRKSASYYYSLPHMRVAGTISRKGRLSRVTRRSVVRSRVVQRVSGRASRRMGLDRHQFAGRRRVDGVSDSRTRRQTSLGGRHDSTAPAASQNPEARGCGISRRTALDFAAHRHRLSGGMDGSRGRQGIELQPLIR